MFNYCVYIVFVVFVCSYHLCFIMFLFAAVLSSFFLLSFSIFSGSCECALFGKYVDALNKLMRKAVDGMPVVLVQFAKVKIFKGISLTISQVIVLFGYLYYLEWSLSFVTIFFHFHR